MNIVAPQTARAIARPTIAEARDTAYTEWAAMQALLNDLAEDDWGRPTPCTGWTVHMLLRHVVASYTEQARPWQISNRVRRARRDYPQLNALDGRNACQLDDLASLSNTELKAQHARFGPRGIRALARMPALLRRRKLSSGFADVPPQPEDSLDFLVKVLATRDAWMHRIDVADATSRVATPQEHDAAVVAQVVRDIDTVWNGPPLLLTLTGHAGSTWTTGHDKPVATVNADAIDFMRHISGRTPATRPIFDGDPQATAELAAFRIPF